MYLGHVMSNENAKVPLFITGQISSAYAKWNELNSVTKRSRIASPKIVLNSPKIRQVHIVTIQQVAFYYEQMLLN